MRLDENKKSAARFDDALMVYMGNNDNPNDSTLSDILADMMHFCEINKFDFNMVYQNAETHFNAERNGDAFIWLNDGEEEGVADCGCKLNHGDDGNPKFVMCDQHKKGFDLINNKEVRAIIHSSHGDIEINENGNILSIDNSCLCTNKQNQACDFHIRYAPGSGIFDVQEYIKYYGSLDHHIDILDIGFTDNKGHYDPPLLEHREDTKLVRKS